MIEAKLDKGFLFKEEVASGGHAPSFQLSHYPSHDNFLGISLGMSPCELHEKGKNTLIRLFHSVGVRAAKGKAIDGLSDRLIVAPKGIQLVTGTMPGTLPSEQQGLENAPVAILSFLPHSGDEISKTKLSQAGTRARLQALKITFSNTAPGRFVSRWGTLGFRLAVVGGENVRLLKRFYELLIAGGEVAIGLDTQLSLRGGCTPVLMLSKSIPDAWVEAIQIRDDVQNTSDECGSEGMPKRLTGTNLAWKELRPHLVNDEVMFWLKPQDPSTTHTGYVSPAVLKAWAQGSGPLALLNYSIADEAPEAMRIIALERVLAKNGFTVAESILCKPKDDRQSTLRYPFPSKLGRDHGLKEELFTLEELEALICKFIESGVSDYPTSKTQQSVFSA